MEPTDPNAPVPARPGIPEAVDPATGNGVAWSADAHEAALRQPDPLTVLDPLIGPSSLPPIPSGPVAKPDETTVPGLPADDHPSTPLPAETAGDQTTPADASIPAKPPVRTGKRIRKAMEAVGEPAAGPSGLPDAPPSPETQLHPMGLSPFVTWLKGLSGSEYVHPYEEEGLSDILDGKHQDVASETLADLLAAQGYTARAIGMYEALMRKYPEKSAFFAAKIQALQ